MSPLGARRGRLPLQQAALRGHEPDEGQRDRVHPLPGLTGEERQLQTGLRQGRVDVFSHDTEEDSPRLLRWRTADGREGERIEVEGERRQQRGRPHGRAAGQRRPREQQQGHGRGRHQAAPQVVEDLPAGDERQAVAAHAGTRRDDREQPPQDLPVAAHPAVLAARVGEDARRVIVHDLDVGDEGGARVEPLEEVVREQGVLGHASLEGRDERVHVVEPLAGEDPLGEEVLVGVGDRGRVGVDAGVPGVEPGEQRAGGARHRHAHAGLEDAVALGDAADPRVEVRLVQRMGRDADQLLRGVARQAGVGVERDAVADGGEDGAVAGFHREARVRGSPQETVPLLDLAALALPAHEDALARVPLPHPVHEVEAVGAPLGVAGVEGLDPGTGGGQDRLVLRHLARGSVREVAEDREVDVRVEVSERQHLEVLEQLPDPLDARQERRHDDHGPRALRHPGEEVEAGEPPRSGEADAEALDDSDRHVTRRQQQEEGHPGERPRRAAVPVRVGEADAEKQDGQQADRPEVDGGGVGEDEASYATKETGTVRHVGLEIGAAPADEMVADVGRPARAAALAGLARALHRPEGHPELAVPGAVGQVLHGLAVAVAAQEVHPPVDRGRVPLQHSLDEAHRLEVLAPVEGRREAEARDDVRDGDLRRRLALVLAADRLLRDRLPQGEMRVHGVAHRREARAVLAHTLQELHHERRVDLLRERRRLPVPGGVDLCDVLVSRPACVACVDDLVRQAAQVLDERELEHARPGPQLADRERRHRLVAVHEANELLAVEAAVAVADELHGHGVDPSVAGELARGELGQLAVVAARQVLAHVADLRGDEVVVVEQPLRGRRDELPLVHALGHAEVRLAQDAGVVVEAREGVACIPSRRGIDDEAGGQRLRPLLEPLDAQELVAEGLLGGGDATSPQAAERRAETHSAGLRGCRARVRRRPPGTSGPPSSASATRRARWAIERPTAASIRPLTASTRRTRPDCRRARTRQLRSTPPWGFCDTASRALTT